MMQADALDLRVAIDRIYDAVLDAGMWPEILSDVVDRSGGSQAVLLRSDIVSGEGDVFLSRYNDASAWQAYQSYYASINPLHNVADPIGYAADWQPIMLRDEDWMTREEQEATEYHNDFLRPLDASYGLYIRLALEGRMLTAVSVGRGHAQGRFEEQSMVALAPLHDHLVRAATLGRRFSQLQRFAQGAAAAMDAASDSLMLFDYSGRMVHANDAGERLLASGAIAGGTARSSTGARPGDAQLARAVSLANDREDRQASCFSLTDSDGFPARDVSVLPITSSAGLAAAGGPAVLVRVSAASAGRRVVQLIERYGLTAAERSLALSLAAGRSLREIAALRGISVNTARRHLASVFDKTGVHRQAELVALLMQVDQM